MYVYIYIIPCPCPYPLLMISPLSTSRCFLMTGDFHRLLAILRDGGCPPARCSTWFSCCGPSSPLDPTICSRYERSIVILIVPIL